MLQPFAKKSSRQFNATSRIQIFSGKKEKEIIFRTF